MCVLCARRDVCVCFLFDYTPPAAVFMQLVAGGTVVSSLCLSVACHWAPQHCSWPRASCTTRGCCHISPHQVAHSLSLRSSPRFSTEYIHTPRQVAPPLPHLRGCDTLSRSLARPASVHNFKCHTGFPLQSLGRRCYWSIAVKCDAPPSWKEGTGQRLNQMAAG